MPNWCSNIAIVNHEDVNELNKLVQEVGKLDGAQLFETFVPYPLGGWDYDWSVNNWGTKWEAKIYEHEVKSNGVRFNFDTAWSPPIEFYERMVEKGFEVEAYYFEEGMDIAGQYIDGDHKTFNGLSEMTADELLDCLPEKLDEIFSISVYARENEQEGLHPFHI
jgi:hypothetical protein